MELGYVADVSAWISDIFFVHTLHEICVCSHMGTLGGSRDVFFKINECTPQTTLLNAIFKPLGVLTEILP
jgi:hypothetical protein